ncbi:MAG: hypothetical protein H6R14_170 [Proteobacteria bacterium]|nr:hypothetical protein [Pseudomonadota bacterium]
MKTLNQNKKPNRLAGLSEVFVWLPDLGSNQGPTD